MFFPWRRAGVAVIAAEITTQGGVDLDDPGDPSGWKGLAEIGRCGLGVGHSTRGLGV